MDTFKIRDGWIDGVTTHPSPHFDHRPEQSPVDLLVIHNISLPPNQFGGSYISDLFTGTLDCQAHPFFAQLEGLRVSAHCLIRRDGEIIQYVSFNDRAWHAGVSEFQGRERCNDFSIGIELEGCDTQPFELEQYQQLVALTHAIMRAYPKINSKQITGHSDIAPGRKTDPGPHFNWPLYLTQLEKSS